MAKKVITSDIFTAEFVEKLAKEDIAISKKDAKKVIKTYFETLEGMLEKKEFDTLRLQGFGTFSSHTSKKRKGINPQTKKMVIYPPKKTFKFKASTTLKERLNKK